MPFDLPLPRRLARAGWKVKIRDKERLEEPHVTIIRGTACWRLGLRTRAFLDQGQWKDIPDQLRTAIEVHWKRICQARDAMYPHNPIAGEEEANDDAH